MRILVVDDEQDICDILQFCLEQDGYEVDTANSAEEALELNLPAYDLFMLDVMMGPMSGFELVERLRANAATADTPILMLSALSDEGSKVNGLNTGADDYVAKPFGQDEVRARVAALLRRSHRHPSAPAESVFVVGPFSVNLHSKTVTIDDVAVQVTPLEMAMLDLMLHHPGQIFTRDEIMARCWPNDTLVTERTVDVNITRLRKKLGPAGNLIKSRSGFGYGIELP